jgi:hypothetical protein
MNEKIHAGYILEMLLPNGGYAAYGTEFEDIVWLEATPITKAEYEAGVLAYPAWKAAKDAQAAANKAAILDKIGITADEAKLLIG